MAHAKVWEFVALVEAANSGRAYASEFCDLTHVGSAAKALYRAASRAGRPKRASFL